MVRFCLFIYVFTAILQDVISQSKWIGGAPILFYQNHVTSCGPYHFVADWDKLYRNTPDFKGWERLTVSLGSKKIWSMHGHGNRLIVCTDPGNIYYSDDFGSSFVSTGTNTGSGPKGEFFQTNDAPQPHCWK